ncbi:MAG TPA: MCE family protein [Acidimicrobiales bacterium]|nr:MCE family protein [Acidimicrobiales bacterium]
MTVEIAQAAGVPEKRRLSLESIQESRRGRALLGLLVAAAIAAGVYAILLAFTGRFTNLVHINAQLPASSNAVTVGAPVQYRNVTVGKIASETQSTSGSVNVKLDFYPDRIVNVPKGVESQVAPLSIFGNQYVDLVPPAAIGQGHLEAGDFIPAYTGEPSTSLQGTTTQLYDLLNAIHPADLNTALSAFATALNGEGTKLGQALDAASQFTAKTIQPNLDNIQSDLRLLVPVSNEVAAATPDLLGLLGNSETTGATITNQAANLHTLLATGGQATGQLATIFQQAQTDLINLMNQSGPLLSDVTANPNELSLTLSGLDQFAAALSSAESHGPFLSVTANLPVTDISAGVNAALGFNNPTSIATALGSAFNPATYTAANCPQYPGASNPYCGSGGSPAATPPPGSGKVKASDVGLSGGSRVGAASNPATPRDGVATSSSTAAAGSSTGADSYPYAQELQAIQSIAAALNGGRPPASPAVAEILLYPLFVALSGTS